MEDLLRIKYAPEINWYMYLTHLIAFNVNLLRVQTLRRYI